MNKAQVTPNQGVKKKKSHASLEVKKARAGWVFVLPFVIGFVLIYVPLIFDSIRLSFSDLTRTESGVVLDFIGFANYREALFTDASFSTTLAAGLKQLVIDVPAIVIFSLFMAVMMNQKMLGRAVFRAIFFLPVIVATGIVAKTDLDNKALVDYMSNGEEIETGAESAKSSTDIISYADVSILFNSMKIGNGLVKYVTQLVNDIYNIVNRSGVQLLIFLAGLQSISPAIYESCSIDGATSWETFWKITFPMISPMILVNTVYTVIDAFTASTNPVMTYITEVGKNRETLAPAMSWIYFLIVILAVAAVSGILSAYIFYQRKD